MHRQFKQFCPLIKHDRKKGYLKYNGTVIKTFRRHGTTHCFRKTQRKNVVAPSAEHFDAV